MKPSSQPSPQHCCIRLKILQHSHQYNFNATLMQPSSQPVEIVSQKAIVLINHKTIRPQYQQRIQPSYEQGEYSKPSMAMIYATFLPTFDSPYWATFLSALLCSNSPTFLRNNHRFYPLLDLLSSHELNLPIYLQQFHFSLLCNLKFNLRRNTMTIRLTTFWTTVTAVKVSRR